MDHISLSPQTGRQPVGQLIDAFGREITYLRLSVTDRCNLRCQYCMGKDVKFLPKTDVLTLEEMERLCAAFLRLGIRKLRLTGGEPLLRPGVTDLIERFGVRLARGEFDELTLTTNGTLLAENAVRLAAAGVHRVNVSLDTLDATRFRQITQRGTLAEVLAGIHAARAAHLAVRINIVAMAGVSDAEYDRMIDWAGCHGCDIALIELMPFGASDSTLYQPLDPIHAQLAERWTLTPDEKGSGGPCRYWKIAETGHRIGFITPMSHGFCSSCNRVRVTCTGRLVPCMARHDDIDLRAVLRDSEADELLEKTIIAAINAKPEGHQFNLPGAPSTTSNVRRMWQMGG